MSDRAWRWNLVLMGWTVTLLAAALVAWLFLHPATDRYQSLKAGILDRATGESYFYSDQWPTGPGHISRLLASPSPRAAAEGWTPNYPLWLHRVLAAPQFQSLSSDGRATVLRALYAKHDPTFAALNPDQQQRAIGEIVRELERLEREPTPTAQPDNAASR